jgi:hypothetical protein
MEVWLPDSFWFVLELELPWVCFCFLLEVELPWVCFCFVLEGELLGVCAPATALRHSTAKAAKAAENLTGRRITKQLTGPPQQPTTRPAIRFAVPFEQGAGCHPSARVAGH